MKYLNRFDRIAPYYDRLAAVIYGSAIREAQTRYLSYVPAGANVLVLGGGTGWWLNGLLATNRTCTIWYVEASARMIQRAINNSLGSSRVRFVHGTHKDIPVHVRFDAVITFFFFDLFDKNTLDALFGDIKRAMHDKSMWLVSDFVKKRKWHTFMLFIMYSFFSIMGATSIKCLPDWENSICNHNVQLTLCTSYFRGFIQSNLYKV